MEKETLATPLTDAELEAIFNDSEEDCPCDFAGRSYGWSM